MSAAGESAQALFGARVVVFGGSSGVGLAVAAAARAAGAEVVLAARGREKLERALARLGEGARGEVVDGRDERQVDDLFARLGPIDHLVLPAGSTTPGGEFTKMTRTAMRATFEDKLWAQLNPAFAGARSLRRGGSITFFSGGAAHRAIRGMANVAAVNGALEALVPTLALELAPSRVNAISPGTLDTPYWTGVPDEAKQAIFARTADALPAGRVGTAEDVAAAVLFLLGSSFTTGIVLRVDGGLPLSRV